MLRIKNYPILTYQIHYTTAKLKMQDNPTIFFFFSASLSWFFSKSFLGKLFWRFSYNYFNTVLEYSLKNPHIVK